MRILFADLAKARRDLIDSKVLDDASFLTRLWYRNLFWICSFIKTESGIYVRRPIRFTTALYCKLADRLFGGNRYEQYLVRQQKEYERLQAKIRELKKQQQERAERRFVRETLYHALTNPHFVATPHTHQDR
jgi:hypothetical protein